jgi:hypothetical protein
MSTTPIYSAGARYERKALREYLARRIEKYIKAGHDERATQLALVLVWVKTRQSRYDKKPGGL